MSDSNSSIVELPVPKIVKDYYQLNPKPLVFADIETTGLSAHSEEITELAAILYQGGDHAQGFAQLVKPGKSIPRRITEFTGISNDMVANASGIKRVLPQFLDFVSTHDVICYNSPFDERFIKAAGRKHNIKVPHRFIDALETARDAFPRLHNHKLSTLAKKLNVANPEAHRALNDCVVLMEVYIACKSRL